MELKDKTDEDDEGDVLRWKGWWILWWKRRRRDGWAGGRGRGRGEEGEGVGVETGEGGRLFGIERRNEDEDEVRDDKEPL